MSAGGHRGWDGGRSLEQPLRRTGRRGPSAQRPCFLGEVTAPLCGLLTGNRYLRWVFRKLNAQIRPQGAKETSGVSVRGTRGCPRPLPVLLHEQHQGHSGFGGHRPPHRHPVPYTCESSGLHMNTKQVTEGTRGKTQGWLSTGQEEADLLSIRSATWAGSRQQRRAPSARPRPLPGPDPSHGHQSLGRLLR